MDNNNTATEAAEVEVYNVLLSHSLTVRQAHDVVSAVRDRIFENITARREALYEEKIK